MPTPGSHPPGKQPGLWRGRPGLARAREDTQKGRRLTEPLASTRAELLVGNRSENVYAVVRVRGAVRTEQSNTCA